MENECVLFTDVLSKIALHLIYQPYGEMSIIFQKATTNLCG